MGISEKEKLRGRLYYYKNREKRLVWQREYDKRNKERKKLYDRKRRADKWAKEKNRLETYARRNFKPILLKKYGGCQMCSEHSGPLEVHHIRYTERIEDCLLLCRDCHKKIHRKPLKNHTETTI